MQACPDSGCQTSLDSVGEFRNLIKSDHQSDAGAWSYKMWLSKSAREQPVASLGAEPVNSYHDTYDNIRWEEVTTGN